MISAGYPHRVPAVTLRLFAAAREAAGTAHTELVADDVAGVLDWARKSFGAQFGVVLSASRVWLNGETVEPATAVADGDEIAVLPPVSGGA